MTDTPTPTPSSAVPCTNPSCVNGRCIEQGHSPRTAIFVACKRCNGKGFIEQVTNPQTEGEAVAWIAVYGVEHACRSVYLEQRVAESVAHAVPRENGYVTPLYTHPAPQTESQLRARLEGLIEGWQRRAGVNIGPDGQRLRVCADELRAILSETKERP